MGTLEVGKVRPLPKSCGDAAAMRFATSSRQLLPMPASMCIASCASAEEGDVLLKVRVGQSHRPVDSHGFEVTASDQFVHLRATEPEQTRRFVDVHEEGIAPFCR
jgi:hypothetical protein